MNRRRFLKTGVATATGFWVAERLASSAYPRSAIEKINFAGIGVGGKGSSDIDQCAPYGNIVAICDVDENALNAKAQKFPEAKKYTDYRQMFEEMGDKIDAVTVSTPDHHHAPASALAIKLKKHVYCQKPLTHSVYEARYLRDLARKMGVATQMGNQGTAENGLRRAVEIIQAGILGPVREVHVWTNRPIWPQGAEAILRVGAARAAAMAALRGRTVAYEAPKPPRHVHWDLFLGPAPERPYDPLYHPFNWRGWWDFGTGALGDMGCHTANMPFLALKLEAPVSVVSENGEINPETCPTWAKVTYEFPARGDMPPVKVVWYEGQRGGNRVLPPQELLNKVLRPYERLSDSGCILVGDKGILFSPHDYGANYRLAGDNVKDLEEAARKVPESLPRNGKGDAGMKEEWVQAIRSGKPSIALSNFDYAGPLTEFILLGNVAMRVGKKMEWNALELRSPNCPEADRYIRREYRSGWTL
jgi:predicted dehydrogenase